MAKLINIHLPNQNQRLVKDEVSFKIAFTTKLDNGYELKDLSRQGIKDFQDFLKSTVYKDLSISDVEKLYRRGDDKSLNDELDCPNIIHFGKNHNPFRIFGYYNRDGYFVITRVDAQHQTHRRP